MACPYSADLEDVRYLQDLDSYKGSFPVPHRYGSKVIADAVGAINAPRRTAEYNGESIG